MGQKLLVSFHSNTDNEEIVTFAGARRPHLCLFSFSTSFGV